MSCIITYNGQNFTQEDFLDYLKSQISTKKFNSRIEIKPGVEELFESNPELANFVYEALGFKNKLKTFLGKELEYKDAYISVNRLKDFKQYQVLDEKGNDIGSVVIEYRGDKNVILHPKLNISGKGYGKDLYKLISSKFNVEIQEWNEGGISNSDSAKAMWDSLEKEGSAKRIVDEEQGDNFRVVKYNTQITLQQKQEAQQLYSEYLDTIFPDSKVKDIVYHGTNETFEEFLEDSLNYFGTKAIAKGYGKNLYPVVIEINKPYYEDGGNLSNQSYEDLYDKLDESGSDGFISNGKNLFVPKTEEQIHILGSKQDIEGFKDFVKTFSTKNQDFESSNNLSNFAEEAFECK